MLISTATIVVALGLLDAGVGAVRPGLRRAARRARRGRVRRGQGRRTRSCRGRRRAGVEAAAGPFGQAVVGHAGPEARLLAPRGPHGGGPSRPGRSGGPARTSGRAAGRPRPARSSSTGPSDGRHPAGLTAAPRSPSPAAGADRRRVRPSVSRYGRRLGRARADGGAAPDRHPDALPLHRRRRPRREIRAGLAAVTAGLPPDALTASQSYLDPQGRDRRPARAYLPFLTVFGVLGLVVAVLIVGQRGQRGGRRRVPAHRRAQGPRLHPEPGGRGLPDDGLRPGGRRLRARHRPRRTCWPSAAAPAFRGRRGVARRRRHQPLGERRRPARHARRRRVSPRSCPRCAPAGCRPPEAISAGSAPRAGRGLRVQRRLGRHPAAALGQPGRWACRSPGRAAAP